jgi:hypothetical protein
MADALEYTGIAPDWITWLLGDDSTVQENARGGVREITLPQVKDAADAETRYPAVLIGPPVWEETLLGNGDRVVWAIGRYEVTAVGLLYQIRVLEQIAARFKPLLHGQPNRTPPHGGYISSCAFKRPVRSPQTVGDLTFMRVGGIFRIKVRLSNN